MKRLLSAISILLVLAIVDTGSMLAEPPYHPIAAVQMTNGSAFVLTSEGSVFAANLSLTSGAVVSHFSFPLFGYLADMTYGNVGGQNLLFVASAFSTAGRVQGRVQAFTTGGKLVRTWATPHVVAGLTFDMAAQTVYFASGDSPEIYSISANSSGTGASFTAEVSGSLEAGLLGDG